jgi:hypothetical protein
MEILDISMYLCIFLMGVIVGRLLMALEYALIKSVKPRESHIKPKLEP